jgi:uncharacterized membrane protein
MNHERKSRRAKERKELAQAKTTPSQDKNLSLPQPQLDQVYLAQHFSGPLPTPKDLEYYNHICPGAADRIIRMAEKEQNRRIDEQNHITKYNETGLTESANITKQGQKYAYHIAIFMLAIISGATYLGQQGSVIALSIALGSGVVSAFLSDKDKKNNSTEEQLQQKQQIEDASQENKKAGK